MRIALIADELTTAALRPEASIKPITPLNYKIVLGLWKPDILFVESAWKGHRDRLKFKIASYPAHPKRDNSVLQKIVKYAKKIGIPTVFWNKEDGVHFDRFIESARLFDHIFTVDENCVPKYREVVGPEVTVNTLMFAVQPLIHNFTGFHFKYHRADFVGSYSHHIHDRRREWQDMLFQAASESGLGLTIFDRNSSRKSSDYRYPKLPDQEVRASITSAQTAQVYKDHLVSFNVNTVEGSGTMFSRRLVEILACGGIVVTNPTIAVERYFKDYCHVVHDKEELLLLVKRLQEGPSREDLQRAEAGAKYVLAEHTWAHRLQEIREVVGIHR